MSSCSRVGGNLRNHDSSASTNTEKGREVDMGGAAPCQAMRLPPLAGGELLQQPALPHAGFPDHQYHPPNPPRALEFARQRAHLPLPTNE